MYNENKTNKQTFFQDHSFSLIQHLNFNIFRIEIQVMLQNKEILYVMYFI